MPLAMTPESGCRILKHQGDLVTFTLTTGSARSGTAYLRTNLGHCADHHQEVIRHVEKDQPILNRDWHDLPMHAASEGCTWTLTLPLDEVGCFQAKAFFLPEGQHEPEWPEGDNVRLKVEPAHTVAGNSIYTAFVRQFGQRSASGPATPIPQEQIALLDGEGYTVIPPAGKFRDLIPHLDHIFLDMGFSNLLLLPIHPVPTTFARMGRFGSPYASMDFMDVNPALAVFDRKSTPMEQFIELVDEVHARDGRIFIDLPINHTGWASHLQVEHPDWFARHEDRAFKSPGAWGVTWEDLSELDYHQRALWYYMADVFLFWCRQGVDGFRCDAGYMVPAPVWEYIAARVRSDYPDTIFLLEGLGGHLHVMEDLLGVSGLNWAYSELFQNYDRDQVYACAHHADRVSHERGIMIHFAETHDNNRLASISTTHACMRILLSGLFSQAGGFGITNGVEWFADQKLNVHGNTSLSWGNPSNAIDLIRRLQRLLNHHPAFEASAHVEPIDSGNWQVAAAFRRAAETSQCLLVVVNLDTVHSQSIHLPDEFADASTVFNLLEPGDPLDSDGALTLTPGQGMVLSTDADDAPSEESKNTFQIKRNIIIGLHRDMGAQLTTTESYLDGCVAAFSRDPADFLVRLAGGVPAVVHVHCRRDLARTIMAAPGQCVLFTSDRPFQVNRTVGAVHRLRSVSTESGDHVVVVTRGEGVSGFENMKLTLFNESGINHHTISCLWTVAGGEGLADTWLERSRIHPRHHGLLTNGRGAMAQCRAAWSSISSQYDAMLAANLDPECPVDRHILWTRCRAWVVYRGYSSELNLDCQSAFSADQNHLNWFFDVPCGMGAQVRLHIALQLVEGKNIAMLNVQRLSAGDGPDLGDELPVKLILRPDIESRSFHHKTKAYSGPETYWPARVKAAKKSFTFSPDPGIQLKLDCSGEFNHESEWVYNVHHPVDEQRGLDKSSDLFSPGWFSQMLSGGDILQLTAEVNGPATSRMNGMLPPPARMLPLADVLRESADHYIVARNQSRTVIAGYPWFLDWGRDTFIALRGYIRLGRLDDAADILSEFGRYEEHGTIPNMIRGHDASNRDTSDAPLWFVSVCREWIHAHGSDDLLERDCGGRSIMDVIESIVTGYKQGTPNGITMDPSSGLIFSPNHYTWMDTAHPAGTPRQGYPIEIQALWYSALNFLAERNPSGDWTALADQVRASVMAYYTCSPDIGLSDCLHGHPGMPASECLADNALRPNQLLAVTLGLIDDPDLEIRILEACAELLVPGAIRSLSNRPLKDPLEITFHGELLNDPYRPYRGHYGGDEDRSRKPAYHNGTAWTWMFPLYPEAFFKVHGESGRAIAWSLLESSQELLNSGCLLQLPEICDGDSPHEFRGCGAQAWGVTEWCRVYALLTEGINND
jgi:glycogen debranching enzyme